MKKVIALVLLLAVPAFAQELVTPTPPVTLVPRCLNDEEQLALARVLKQKDAENAALKKDMGVPVGLVVLSVTAALVLGGAAGVAAGVALSDKK